MSQCNLNVEAKRANGQLPYLSGAPKYRLVTFRLTTFLGWTRGDSKTKAPNYNFTDDFPAQFLEHVDQRQCFRAGARQQRFERFSPSAEPVRFDVREVTVHPRCALVGADSAQGPAGLACCLGGHAISCAPGGVRIGTLSSMAALSGGACSRLRCRAAWRILGFLPFNMTAETEAHG